LAALSEKAPYLSKSGLDDSYPFRFSGIPKGFLRLPGFDRHGKILID
jgi:hypothetical protein